MVWPLTSSTRYYVPRLDRGSFDSIRLPLIRSFRTARDARWTVQGFPRTYRQGGNRYDSNGNDPLSTETAFARIDRD